MPDPANLKELTFIGGYPFCPYLHRRKKTHTLPPVVIGQAATPIRATNLELLDLCETVSHLAMRATTICVCGREVDVFVEHRSDAFELWLVTAIKGVRTTVLRYLTTDNLELRLKYAKRRPLTWRHAQRQEIPARKTAHVAEWERRVKAGKTVHFDKVSYYFAALPPWEVKEANAARKLLLGSWRGDDARMDLGANHTAMISYTQLGLHLTVGREPPDRWTFSNHGLHLMNRREKVGAWVRVLHVDDRELHLWSLRADRLADIFVRVRA